MAYGTVQADVIGTSVAGSNLGAGNASIMKNRIINGAMVINQRALGTVTIPASTQTYTIDRMRAYSSAASKYSVSQATNTGLALADGFNYSYNVTSLSAYSSGSSDIIGIAQNIEGYNIADLQWGTASAKTVTLSFWVQSSLTGTFGGSLYNASGNYSYPFSYTIASANTWQKIAITIAGPTSGTWSSDNSTGVNVWFDMGSGTTFKGTASTWAGSLYFAPTGSVNVVGTNAATWQITALQLEVGSSATGFEYRQYGQELALCQRYYWKNKAVGVFDGFGAGFANTSTTSIIYFKYAVTMRAAPTVSINTLAIYSATGGVTAISALGASNFATDSGQGNFTTSGLTTGQGAVLIANASSSAYIDYSSEL